MSQISCDQISMQKCNSVIGNECATVDVCNNKMIVERSCACGALKFEVTHAWDVVCDITMMVERSCMCGALKVEIAHT